MDNETPMDDIVQELTAPMFERIAVRHQIKAFTAFGAAAALAIYGINNTVLAVASRIEAIKV